MMVVTYALGKTDNGVTFRYGLLGGILWLFPRVGGFCFAH